MVKSILRFEPMVYGVIIAAGQYGPKPGSSKTVVMLEKLILSVSECHISDRHIKSTAIVIRASRKQNKLRLRQAIDESCWGSGTGGKIYK